MPKELEDRLNSHASLHPDDAKIGENIRRAYEERKRVRKSKGQKYSMQMVAAEVGITREQLNRIMLGGGTSPETLLKIMRALKIPAGRTFKGVENLFRWQWIFDQGVTMSRHTPHTSRARGYRHLLPLLDDSPSAEGQLNEFLGGCDYEAFYWAKRTLIKLQQTIIRRRRHLIKKGLWQTESFEAKRKTKPSPDT